MYELQGKTMIYRLDSRGRSISCYHRQTGHEYIHTPGAVWKLIYAVKNTERVEVPVWAEEQRFSVQTGENQPDSMLRRTHRRRGPADRRRPEAPFSR